LFSFHRVHKTSWAGGLYELYWDQPPEGDRDTLALLFSTCVLGVGCCRS